MKQIIIDGNKELSGTIEISGAKNSALALIPASILSDGIVKIDNIPNISDIDSIDEILIYLGAKITKDGKTMTIDSTNIVNKPIPESISTKLRASYYFMSALLGKYKRVEMYFPGGCSIGARPIDQTLKSFRALGAKVEEYDDRYVVTAEKLVGNNIYLDMPSVGATINAMLAAVKATGVTVISNAAKEPEIVSTAIFLNNMGAKITGAGTTDIKIIGVEKLNGCFTEVIPDRIEAGTYIIAGALAGNNLKIANIIPKHVESLLSKLDEMNIKYELGTDYVIISKALKFNHVSIQTEGYPGFPTDLQQPVTALLTQATGMSVIHEKIYENRFKHVCYLNSMGSNIGINGRKLFIIGPANLKGHQVAATDLRAGATMVLAALAAEGVTHIDNAEHILRGYEDIINKLKNVGASISMIEK